MTIYIDADFKCHTAAADGLRAFDVDFFDGKCRAYIEGYRYIPADESWTRADGTVFTGEMVTPWRDYAALAAAQAGYAEAQSTIAEYESALTEIEAALEVNT